MTKQTGETDLDPIRHSLAHLLAAAVLKKYPEAKLGVGPTIDNGFYYDFVLPESITPENLKNFEKDMRGMIYAKLPMSGESITPAKAKTLFKNQPFKLELIKDLTKPRRKVVGAPTAPTSAVRSSDRSVGEASEDKKQLTIYKTGDIFTDLCRGGHVDNTSEINPESFKLDKIAGAYWRGDEKNPQMQRIYGLAFNSKEELEEYAEMRAESEKRDHRKLGKELGLFTISDEVGPGLPLFYPKGALLRREIENLIAELQERRGYEAIWIPHITKGELYKISGHLDKYDAMYPPMHLKNEDAYYLKPMNCPHFMMLYKSTPHSYRELPIRWTSTTTNYRYEKSGELSGLTRVRALTQDDCHVFARPDQIEAEINLMLDMIEEVYDIFGFKNFWVRISTHDQANKEKYIGDPQIWRESETILAELIQKRGWEHKIVEGEAAFYGPKLDFMFKDVLGREWQLSTIQLDMNLPQKFNLEYIDTDGSKKQPVVIHRAILGSTERFLGILIEHLGGAFPFWLAPEQIIILPISEKQNDYAQSILRQLKSTGVRVTINSSNNTVGKKIREAEMQKFPYIAVVGAQEETNKTINVRKRGQGNLGEMTIEQFLTKETLH